MVNLRFQNRLAPILSLGAFSLFLLCIATVQGADQPQRGQYGSRNMVSKETGLPDWFDPGKRDSHTGDIDLKTTQNVKWVARLGKRAYATPIVAEGKVYVGTNNDAPRDPRIEGDRGVLMCFEETSGRFLWQLTVPKKSEIKYWDTPRAGITSPPTVEKGRVYVMSNRYEVMCLDANGMADGNNGPYLEEGRHMAPADQPPLKPGPTDADIIWCYDIVAQLGIRGHDSPNCSILLHGDYLYICTGNGLGVNHAKVAEPDAPAFIVLDKHTGKLVARDDFGVGANIVHGQWSSAALGQVGSKTLIFFGAGDGHIYASEAIRSAPAEGIIHIKPLWNFNGQPSAQTGKEEAFQPGRGSQSYTVVATPVFYKNRVYVAFSHDPWIGKHKSYLACIDATGTGDITRSGLIWSHDGLSDCMATVSLVDDLLYLVDRKGTLCCFDAATGHLHWSHSIGGQVWGSTLVADGKIYICSGRQELWVFAVGKEKKLLQRVRLRDQVLTSLTAANGTLFLATAKHLYAIAAEVASASH